MSEPVILWPNAGQSSEIRLVYVPGRKPQPTMISSEDERYVVELCTNVDAMNVPTWENVHFLDKARRVRALDALAVALGEQLRGGDR